MATECPTCAAVANGGRVRITKDSGMLMLALLKTARRESVRARRDAINENALREKQEADNAIRTIETLYDEIARTMEEKGWPNGQRQRSHP